jgi:hypothetical protein
MQKKMQKVEGVNLKNRINSGFSKKFDSAPGHQIKSPLAMTSFFFHYLGGEYAGVAQLVERYLAKV